MILTKFNCYKNLKKNFCKFYRKFLKTLIDWLWKCWDVMKFLWKFVEILQKRENFLEISGKPWLKFEQFTSKLLSRFWLNLTVIQIFKKTFVNFKENLWKLWLTDCENVEMWWNFYENLWKFYEKEKIF